MKISIFPKVSTAHPSTKEEKGKQARFVSKPHEAVQVNVGNEEELFDLVTTNAWSPSCFRQYRRLSDFLFADMIALDIDEGLGIDQAVTRLKKANLTALVAPSPSHREDNPRFRIIFPLVSRISDVDVFEATWQKLFEVFPESDAQCKDASRFYFGCKPEVDSCHWIEKELLEPAKVVRKELTRSAQHDRIHKSISTEDMENKDVLSFLYGEVPENISEAVAFFLEKAHTGLEGCWTNSLNAAVFALALKGIDDGKIWQAIEEVAPEALDDKDDYQINKAIRDGKRVNAENADIPENVGRSRRRRRR